MNHPNVNKMLFLNISVVHFELVIIVDDMYWQTVREWLLSMVLERLFPIPLPPSDPLEDPFALYHETMRSGWTWGRHMAYIMWVRRTWGVIKGLQILYRVNSRTA